MYFLIVIIAFVASIANASTIKYYDNPKLTQELSRLIHSYSDNKESLNKVNEIYENEDLYWAAIYLNSLHSKDKDLEQMFYNKRFSKEDVFKHYFLKYNKKPPKNVVFVDSASSIFQNQVDVLAYIPDINHQSLFLDLVHSTKSQLGDYLDNNFDLAGRSSLVRKGLVKLNFFKDHVFVSKRNNPDKKGRFIKEQENIEKLKSILGIHNQTDWLLINDVKLKLLSPFAIFSSGDSKFYSLTFFQSGRSLEEVILEEKDLNKRKKYLRDMRSILDFLYQKGIIWGDMSPRNVLVEESDDEICYTILDFEKTVILDRPVAMHEREEHARGPMCVEEFGAICTEEEVTEAFTPYFNPAAWDLTSQEPIPFIHPKEEIISLLKARGISKPTLGDYNKLEKEILQVRFFEHFAGHENYASLISVGFKIFHYLGHVYDMKTTEILLHAQKHQMLIPTITVLAKFLEAFENKLILQDFEDIVLGRPPTLEHKHNRELDALAKAIDSFNKNS